MKRMIAWAVLGVFGLIIVVAVVVFAATMAYSAFCGNPGAQTFVAMLLLFGVGVAVSWAVGVLYDEPNRPKG